MWLLKIRPYYACVRGIQSRCYGILLVICIGVITRGVFRCGDDRFRGLVILSLSDGIRILGLFVRGIFLSVGFRGLGIRTVSEGSISVNEGLISHSHI